MPCKNCGHNANLHEYNRDWKVRERCVNHIINHTKNCNCEEFVK